MNKEGLEQFRLALRDAGIEGGLKSLNATVEHRYTALYRLHDTMLTNIGLCDKAGEVTPEHLATVPLGESFCQFVLRDGIFLTGDSGSDTRLDGHPYQGVMMAYHGVPVCGPGNTLFGTLCHFDTVQRQLADDDFVLLQQAATEFSAVLNHAAS